MSECVDYIWNSSKYGPTQQCTRNSNYEQNRNDYLVSAVVSAALIHPVMAEMATSEAEMTVGKIVTSVTDMLT